MIVFSLPADDAFADALAAALGADRGRLAVHSFPDGERLVRLDTPCDGRHVVAVASLHHPDDTLLPAAFLCDGAKDLGAARVTLVAPYLGYLRQDQRFHPGEVVTSRTFAKLLSAVVDEVVTVDPHLHRYETLGAVYTVPGTVVHAAPAVADWIRAHVDRPLLIGPDEESLQWVADVAGRAGAPYVVLEKVRRGDRDVEVSVPEVDRWRDHTPVLVDDIISTARTMARTAEHIRRAGLPAPVCVGVHAVFAEGATEALAAAGVTRVVTADTIPHATNGIGVAGLVAAAIRAA